MFSNKSQKTKNKIVLSSAWMFSYFIIFFIIFKNVEFNLIGLIFTFVVPIFLGWFKIWNIKTVNINYLKKIRPFLLNEYNTPKQPKTVFWFEVFCLIIILINFLFLLLLLQRGDWLGHIVSEDIIWIISIMATFVLYIPPLVLPRKQWVWVFNITLLGISVTSIILIPVVVPLIVLYSKPEVRNFYKS